MTATYLYQRGIPWSGRIFSYPRYMEAKRKFYVDSKKDSRRFRPEGVPDLQPGDWLVEDRMGLYGHDVYVVMRVPAGRLEPGEVLGKDRIWDSDRYIEWMRKGHQPPPIFVVEQDRPVGNLKVIDGHRRLRAFTKAGIRPLVMISPSFPSGRGLDSNGRELMTGLTIEHAAQIGIKVPKEWRLLLRNPVRTNPGGQTDATEMFLPSVIDAKKELAYKSRDLLIKMPIRDFLTLALRIAQPSQSKMDALSESLGRGEKLRTIPFLLIRRSPADPRVVKVYGHEGRHRAFYLLSRGYTHMPVILSSDIRWSEQDDPLKYDYVKVWPEFIEAEKSSFLLPFPIARKQIAQIRTNPPQRTPYTCGPAVALDVLADHGVRTTEQAVAAVARSCKRSGTTAGGLVRALRAGGVPARALKPSTVQVGDLVRLWSGDEDHWVRVRDISAGRTYVTFYDPWTGRSRTITMDTFQAMRRQAQAHRFSVVRA